MPLLSNKDLQFCTVREVGSQERMIPLLRTKILPCSLHHRNISSIALSLVSMSDGLLTTFVRVAAAYCSNKAISFSLTSPTGEVTSAILRLATSLLNPCRD